MDLAKSSEWKEEDLLALITNAVEESVNLDYKKRESLQKRDGEKKEISKDVSSFANSAGGVIAYGMVENDHKPTALDAGYDPTDVTKEWLEHVIPGTIRPRINGIHINPVALTNNCPGRVAYVVTIPQGRTAHQASDLRYYKRFNFEAVPMYDHEVRDVMNRLRHPLIEAIFNHEVLSRKAVHEYKLNIVLKNIGAMRAREVKLVFYWPHELNPVVSAGYSIRNVRGKITVAGTESTNIELTVVPTGQGIFPEDELRITEDSRFRFHYKVDQAAFGFIRSRNPHVLWKVFADDMPPQSGSFPISDIQDF